MICPLKGGNLSANHIGPPPPLPYHHHHHHFQTKAKEYFIFLKKISLKDVSAIILEGSTIGSMKIQRFVGQKKRKMEKDNVLFVCTIQRLLKSKIMSLLKKMNQHILKEMN